MSTVAKDTSSIVGSPIALATGANKGIGKEISSQLSAKGTRVLMGAREQRRRERTVEQGAATPVRLALLPDDGPTAGVFSNDGVEQR